MNRIGRTALALLAFALAAPALAKTAPKAAAPDITGVWMVQPAYYLGQPLKPAAVLTPAAVEQRKRRQAATQSK